MGQDIQVQDFPQRMEHNPSANKELQMRCSQEQEGHPCLRHAIEEHLGQGARASDIRDVLEKEDHAVRGTQGK